MQIGNPAKFAISGLKLTKMNPNGPHSARFRFRSGIHCCLSHNLIPQGTRIRSLLAGHVIVSPCRLLYTADVIEFEHYMVALLCGTCAYETIYMCADSLCLHHTGQSWTIEPSWYGNWRLCWSAQITLRVSWDSHCDFAEFLTTVVFECFPRTTCTTTKDVILREHNYTKCRLCVISRDVGLFLSAAFEASHLPSNDHQSNYCWSSRLGNLKAHHMNAIRRRVRLQHNTSLPLLHIC